MNENRIIAAIERSGFGIGWFILILLFCGRSCGTVDISNRSLEEIKTIKCEDDL